MVYIKLENDMYKFMNNKYEKIPKMLKKMIFKVKYKNKQFINQKIDTRDYIILPSVNNKLLRNLKKLSNVRCWKNICVSNNLMENDDFISFANENLLNVMDGKWLFKNIVDKIVEYIAEVRNESLATLEISILCNKLDETIIEKIKEICVKVKICNIITNNTKQYKKLEEEVYQSNGVILNVSNNYRRALAKSSIVINFDFSDRDLEKCIFYRNAYMINIDKSVKVDKKEFGGRNIVSYKMDLPEKYLEYKDILNDFDSSILYESFIYKHTNYRNIKNELIRDEAKIAYLEDSNHKIIKNQDFNLPKKLDKISI